MTGKSGKGGKRRNPPSPWGVPLGGIGTGCVDLGGDGRFRNITTNNNRSAETRIDISEASFLAVRAARRGKVQTRLLQPSSTLPFEQAGVTPLYTPAEHLTWQGLYPSSSYGVRDPQFPVEIHWKAIGPVIPHDLSSSALPAMLLSMSLHNPGDTDVDAAVVFNWENLRGCTREHFPAVRGGFGIVPQEKRVEGPPNPAGLTFGEYNEFKTNTDGNYCLIAMPQQDIGISVMGWNEQDPEELSTFWQSLHYDSKLENQVSRNPESHSAAVCCSLRVPAQQTRSILYVLSWYFPRFEVEGVDQSNGYTRHFKNSVEVATHALKRSQYLFGAVDAWHNRMLSSSLPRWYSRMLLNSNYVFSTNTLLTRSGQFATLEAPGAPKTGSLDRRLHTSLGALLFYPELEGQEFARFAGTALPEAPGRLCRHLGRECAHKPEFAPSEEDLLDLGPKFILLAYRNYHMTGNRPMISALYPRLKEVMEYTLSRDTDGDGLPDHEGVSSTYDGWGFYGANSYTSSLWIAAMRAYARIADDLDHGEEAERYRKLEAKAVARFEAAFWNEKTGYYRMYSGSPENGADAGEACHTGQLAGEWFSEFAGLGPLFDRTRTTRAVSAMYKLNDREFGTARASLPGGAHIANPSAVSSNPRCDLAWPEIDLTHYGCLLMARGRGNEALRGIEKVYTNIHVKGGRTFNQPLYWNPEKNQPCGAEMDRHLGATALWHTLYALEGFLLDAGAHTLFVRPNLPGNVHYLSAPIFTPICFGWLSFQEGQSNGHYRQEVKVSFEESVLLHRIILRAPQSAAPLTAALATPEGQHPVHVSVRPQDGVLSVEVVLENPLVVCKGMQITLQQTG